MARQKPHTLLFLIIVLSIIACSLGRPAAELSNEDKTLTNEQQSPKNKLYLDTCNNFDVIYLIYLNEAQNISKNILKDETLLNYKSTVEIDGFKKNLTQFLEKYNNYRDPEDLNDYVDIFANATEFYMKLPKEAITADTAVIIDTLKKYGSEKLEKKFDELAKEAVEKFKIQFEETKPFLQEEKAMLEWFDHFKTLTDGDEITAAFDKYVEFH